ncbi:family 20 glycosylhydrolase [Bacteroides sp. 224]|uniref:glycoside hydrolase family 20 protein n=1 Tax=Bacteroides sp. 224 TaxID=2302936 RepID=UPI0013D3D680|nr:family 20 glycosylhydrolase [Bacteroides sp. 224]NDV64715.1 beta-N-acetylhexosaminidase [Bacteroides sp. 224]
MKKTKMLLSSLLVIVTLLSCSQTETANYQVIPLPQEIMRGEGASFILEDQVKVVYPTGNEELKRIAEFLVEYIRFSTNIELAITTEQPTEGAFIVLNDTFEHENKEAYTLSVDNDKITINGATAAGAFYGVQTLRKSINVNSAGKKIEFPSVSIVDYPRFAYRGMMLDVARHFFPVDFVKKYIDLLAIHNINRFHWHLTDDQGWRIEIKKYPLLTEVGSHRKETVIGRNSGKYDGIPHGGFYTQEEAREIVAYAKDRFITVIPEVDLPGHMTAALASYPHLGCTGRAYEVGTEWGISDDVLCAGNDEVLTFLEGVFTEIIDIFPSEYIHVGGDECPKVSWRKCPKCQQKIKALGLTSNKAHTAEEGLQSFMISYVEEFLNAKGRQIIGWDEILEGGLPSNATVMSWRGVKGGVAAIKQGNKAILSPVNPMYFDYYQTLNTNEAPLAFGGYIPLEKVYAFEPIDSTLTQEEATRILGVQANLWTSYFSKDSLVEYMILPRMDALAEVQWTSSAKKDYKSFMERLPRMLDFYTKAGYNYATSVYDIASEAVADKEKREIKLSFSTIDNASIYYTLDGSTPTKTSKLYTEPLIISQSTQVNALAIRDKIETPMYSESFRFGKSTAKPITLSVVPNRSYTFGGADALVDGIPGNEYSYKDGHWIGFTRGDIDAFIDLQENTTFSTVEVSTYIATNDWVFGATGLEIAVSADGEDYKTIASESYPVLEGNKDGMEKLTLQFEPVESRYVRVKVKKTDRIPEWHFGKGSSPFIFLDEIVVD